MFTLQYSALLLCNKQLRKGIARYVHFYNQERPHQSLNEAKPDQFYAHCIEEIAS
ncbi:integrase core domain-containing protein [Paenibacillus puerhi]|uniref:integrase core domain-containing protein n=1 Tax=Paenibacillus puerhi TaxID=2692622 RepID=UPI001357B04B